MRVCWRDNVGVLPLNKEQHLRQRRNSLSLVALRALVVRRARGRCEYCRAPQRACGYRFHLDHIIPSAHGGSDDPSNRALACATCNLAKTDKVSGFDPLTRTVPDLFNPRVQRWQDHFRWASGYQTIVGLTSTGRATIAALNLNGPLRKRSRRLWMAAGLLP